MSDASGTQTIVPAELAISVRRATAADAAAVADLVNQAYAVEVFFVEGDRTNAADIADMMSHGTFVVLEHVGGLAAAVYVDSTGYIGMLSVLPQMQKHGLGKRLVRIAEAMCEAAGCDTAHLQIVNLREELARWYRSLGYVETGTRPFEHRALKQPCHFVVMRKTLRSVTGQAQVAA